MWREQKDGGKGASGEQSGESEGVGGGDDAAREELGAAGERGGMGVEPVAGQIVVLAQEMGHELREEDEEPRGQEGTRVEARREKRRGEMRRPRYHGHLCARETEKGLQIARDVGHFEGAMRRFSGMAAWGERALNCGGGGMGSTWGGSSTS